MNLFQENKIFQSKNITILLFTNRITYVATICKRNLTFSISRFLKKGICSHRKNSVHVEYRYSNISRVDIISITRTTYYYQNFRSILQTEQKHRYLFLILFVCIK